MPMNYQHWHGFTDPRFGYGSMLDGFLSNVPSGVELTDEASVSVYMGVPYAVKGWRKGQHRVLFTMWETDELPAAFRRWVPQFDQILVPCHHNVDLFSQHHDNVKFVPLGVDTKFWSPQKLDHSGPFRFHAGGSLWRRKGIDLVVMAFKELKLPNAELHIKAAPHAKDVPTGKLGDNIVLHRDWMSLERQREWFNEADCYVAPARGEGWGLMPLQAIASGVPTILSLSSGQKEFAGLTPFTVPCSKSPAETIGRWDEPDFGELCRLMRDVYNNRAGFRQDAERAVVKAKEFSWKKAAQTLVSTVPVGTKTASGKLVLPTVTMKIRVRRAVNADIGANHYRLVPGVEYEVPENVHQVLSDSGALETEQSA